MRPPTLHWPPKNAEVDAAGAQVARHRKAIRTRTEDGDIDRLALVLGHGQRLAQAHDRPDDLAAQVAQHVLEQHGNQGLVLDDEHL